MTWMMDGLRNLTSRMGTSRDKATASEYFVTLLSQSELDTAWRSSWLAKKIVNLPAEAGVQEWREWQADAKSISLIEAEEARLLLPKRLKNADILGRLRGGAAIYIGTKDPDPSLPLDPSTVKKGDIQYLSVIPRSHLTPESRNDDIRIGELGEVTMYSANTIRIHPSRLALFHGTELPDPEMSGDGWGDSVLQTVLDSVLSHDSVAANILSLTYEAKVDIVKIPDFMSRLRTDGAEYEKAIMDRWSLALAGKGINGAMMMDAEEEHVQKTISFASLPDVWDRFMIAVAGASDIPATRLFGMAPAGMNSTGESDTDNFNSFIASRQSGYTDALRVLDECLIRSALGTYPEEIHYNWRPLLKLKPKDRAEVGDKIAATFKKVYEMDGMVPEAALSKSLINALTESGVAPGLETEVQRYYEGSSEKETQDLPETQVEQLEDAAPQTLYVRRDVLNSEDIIKWAKAQGFPTTLTKGAMHVTLAFSRTPVDWMAAGSSYQDRIEIPAGGPRVMDQFEEARVLLISSPDLLWRHQEIHENTGAEWSHDDYHPHITISWDEGAPDLADVEPYQGPIILGPEIFQRLKEDWKENLVEDEEGGHA